MKHRYAAQFSGGTAVTLTVNFDAIREGKRFREASYFRVLKKGSDKDYEEYRSWMLGIMSCVARETKRPLIRLFQNPNGTKEWWACDADGKLDGTWPLLYGSRHNPDLK